MTTIQDYLQQNQLGIVKVLNGYWVQLTSNKDSSTYVSTAASDANGLFEVDNVPSGTYVVAISNTSNVGPWANTGDNNYEVSLVDASGNGTVSNNLTVNGSLTVNGGFTGPNGVIGKLGTGDEIAFAAASNLSPPQLFEAVGGTAAAPYTTVGPLVKVSLTQKILESQVVNGATNEQTAPLVIQVMGDVATEIQTSAAYFVAQTKSTQSAHNDDAGGICATGRVIGSGTGYGIGGYFDGRRDTNTGHTNGIEVRSGNYGTVDGTFNTNGASDTMGIWITSGGTSTGGGATLGGVLSGVALSMYGLVNTQWATGIGIPAGAVKNQSFYDNSSSDISLKISGTHATAALQIADASGPVTIGSSVAQTPKFMITGTYSDSIGANAILFNLNHSISTFGKQTVLMGGSVTLTAAVAGSHLYSTIAPTITSNPTNDTGKTLTTIYGQFVRLDTAVAYTAGITTIVDILAGGSNHAGSGTIANLHHFRVGNAGAPTGAITNEIGLYIEALTRGGTNRSIYYAGNAGAVASPSEYQNGGSIIVDTTNGLTIATGTTQKLGFFGATPVVQIAGGTDVLAGLVTLGFRAASSNPPLNLGTGTVTAGGLTLSDPANVALGTSTGTQFGTATAQKLAFHGAAAVIQRAGAAQASVVTTASTNTTPFGYTTSAQADAIVTLVNEIRAALVEKGLMKGAA